MLYATQSSTQTDASGDKGSASGFDGTLQKAAANHNAPARAEHFPAIADPGRRAGAVHVRRLMTRHIEIALLLRVGECQRGADRFADEAIAKLDAIREFVKQPPGEARRLGEMR